MKIEWCSTAITMCTWAIVFISHITPNEFGLTPFLVTFLWTTWMSGIIGSHLSKAFDIPHIISFHTMGKTKRTVNHLEHETDFRISNEIELIKDSDAIIVPSLQEQENLEENYTHNNNIYTVSPGVDLDKFKRLDKVDSRKKLGIDQNTLILLSVGNSRYYLVEMLMEPLCIFLGQY